MAGKRVAFVVLNDVIRDARVTREAKSLETAGYEVEIFGITQSEWNLQRAHDGLVVNLVSIQKAATAAVSRARKKTALILAAIAAGLFLLGLIAAVALEFAGLKFAVLAYLAGTAIVGLLVLRRRAVLRSQLVALFEQMQHLAPRSPRVDPNAPAPGSSWPFRARAMAALAHSQREWVERIEAYGEALAASVIRSGEPFDIVHCHDATTLRVGERLKKRFPKIRVVYDSHELYSAVIGQQFVKARWVYELERRASGILDAVITVNDSIADMLQRYHPALPKPVVVCNATPRPVAGLAGDGRLHAAAKLDRDTKILLFQGGMAHHRGLELVTQAGALLPEGWALVHMGWGALKPQLEAMAKVVDPGGRRICFLPPVPQSELAQWSADATVGVILYEPHSLNHVFCSPNKLWEYPRSGVPVLVSEAPEMVRRVQEYGFGWVLPTKALSPVRIARFVESLSDEQIAAAKARCGAYLEADNWSVYEARLLDAYARLGERAR